jgi:predicted phage terminase large subunit-like protein
MFRYEVHEPDWRTWPICIAFDPAIGLKQTSNYTAGIVGALDPYNVIHIIEAVRGRWGTFGIVEAMLDLYVRYNRTTSQCLVGVERGHIHLALQDQIALRCKELKIHPVFDDQLVPVQDKLVRARPAQGRYQHGGIIFPQHQPWTETVVNEHLRFPGGLYDDYVDAMAWLVRMFSRVNPPRVKKKKKQKSFRDSLNQYVTGRGGAKDPMAA